MGWKNDFHQAFLFTRRERNAIMVLFVLLLGAAGAYLALPYLATPPQLNMEEIARLDSLQLAHEQKVKHKLGFPQDSTKRFSIHEQQNTKRKQPKRTLKPFDPNTIDASGWQELGFSPKQAAVIVNYRNKAGGFKSKEHLAKVFVISEKKFEELEPYVRISNKAHKLEQKRSGKEDDFQPDKIKKDYPLIEVDINTADTDGLIKVPGIGPFYAKQIISDRHELGAYKSIDQLVHLYKMTPERLDSLRPFLSLSQGALKKLSINHINTDSLGNHPYLSFKQARVIISYRDKHGPFLSESDLLKIHIIDQAFIDLMRPYLNFEK